MSTERRKHGWWIQTVGVFRHEIDAPPPNNYASLQPGRFKQWYSAHSFLEIYDSSSSVSDITRSHLPGLRDHLPSLYLRFIFNFVFIRAVNDLIQRHKEQCSFQI